MYINFIIIWKEEEGQKQEGKGGGGEKLRESAGAFFVSHETETLLHTHISGLNKV